MPLIPGLGKQRQVDLSQVPDLPGLRHEILSQKVKGEVGVDAYQIVHLGL